MAFEAKTQAFSSSIATVTIGTGDKAVKKQPVRNKDKKVGPNDPCPCGSGKKYKKCCMQKDKLAE